MPNHRDDPRFREAENAYLDSIEPSSGYTPQEQDDLAADLEDAQTWAGRGFTRRNEESTT